MMDATKILAVLRRERAQVEEVTGADSNNLALDFSPHSALVVQSTH